MVMLICGWCKTKFNANVYIDKFDEHSLLICPKCRHQLPSSRKVKINTVGQTHIHEEWLEGDVVV